MDSIIQDHYVTTGKFPVFDHNMPMLYSSRKFARYADCGIPFRSGADLAKWLFRMRSSPHRNLRLLDDLAGLPDDPLAQLFGQSFLRLGPVLTLPGVFLDVETPGLPVQAPPGTAPPRPAPAALACRPSFGPSGPIGPARPRWSVSSGT